MGTSYTALWSVVAATFSALSAVMVMLIQRRNLMESVRPDLIPLDWSHTIQGEGESIHDVIEFRKLRNIGRGAAFNISVGSPGWGEIGSSPDYCMSSLRTPVIAANETIDVPGSLIVWWKNIEDHDGLKCCHIKINMYYTDARNIRYLTEFMVFAIPLDNPASSLTDLAPGVSWTSRNTTTWLIWRAKLIERFRTACQSFQQKS